jgi:MoxR-like ATPase
MVDIQHAESRIIQQIEQAAVKVYRAREETESVIFGQQRVIEQSLVTLLSGGHALLIGVPGLAKTSLVETLGTVLGMDSKRIQFTPDLMPSDIVGSEVLEESESGNRHFRFIKGPVFTQLLMADEINRASPKTQSALLQAMQEHHVTVAGESHELPQPFHVLATQNPLEQEGTYPLPEAQLDRFLLEVNVDYPDEAAERQMLLATTGTERRKPSTVLSPGELMSIQRLVREMPVGEKVVDAILRVVRAARPGTAGPRSHRATASALDCTPSAAKMWLMWFFTVFSARYSSWAMVALENPFAMSSMISTWRGLRAWAGRCGAASGRPARSAASAGDPKTPLPPAAAITHATRSASANLPCTR